VSTPNASFWQHKRVLLTGHTGFKGAWLALWLHQLGAEVYGLSLPPDPEQALYPSLQLTLAEQLVDLRDRQAVQCAVRRFQPEIVLHLAAQPLVRRSYGDPIGTWSTNVLGSLHLLDALQPLNTPCAVVMVTTDKVYENREWLHGYRETDRLGGHDPYSSSKAAMELAVASWRASFCGPANHQNPHLRIATARAGNVIGGGDWATDRIVPDAIRALKAGQPIAVRNPAATRPWQHVLEPLAGYLRLSEALATEPDPPCDAFNFGPQLESNRPVSELIASILSHWHGEWIDASDPHAPHEAALLHLQIDKAHHQLGWQPRWDVDTTVARTVAWYRAVHQGASPLDCCLTDLEAFTNSIKAQELSPA